MFLFVFVLRQGFNMWPKLVLDFRSSYPGLTGLASQMRVTTASTQQALGGVPGEIPYNKA